MAIVILSLCAVVLAAVLAGSLGLGSLVIVVALVAGILMLLRPAVGMALFAAAIPLENLIMVGGMTGTRVIGMVVFAAWFGHKLLAQESWSRITSVRFLYVAAAFMALGLASALWAEDAVEVVSGFKQLLMLLAWSVLVIDLVTSWRRGDLLAKALLFGASMAAILTLQQHFLGGVRRAGDQIAGGVNATAIVLLTLVPFGFYLFRSQESKIWRTFGIAYVAVAVLAIAVTFSRMNMLLLPLLLAAMFWHALWGRRGRRWLVALAVVSVPVIVQFVPWERVQQRAATITPYLEGTLGSNTPTQSSRGFHLKVGLAIARDHPVIGAGYGNYGRLFLNEYQFTVAGADRLYSSERSPHSSYIAILAELGLVGLLAWGVCLWLVMRGVVEAWRMTREEKNLSPHILVQAVTYALLLHVLAYSWYTPSHQHKLVWTLLAMGVAVNAVSTWTRTRERPALRRERSDRRWRHALESH